MKMNSNSSAVIIPAPSPPTNAAATNALTGDIRGIKAPVEIPTGWWWLWGVLGALTAAALAYYAWQSWRKHRLRPQAVAEIIPPHERARRKLQEALKLIYEPRLFCIAVSGTLRSYLEEAFALRAPERTTEEFLNELQSSSPLSLSQKQSLADFLVRCDLVKFARDEPTVEQLKELHESALRLVDETSYFKPQPEAVSPSAGARPGGAAAAPPLPPPLPASAATEVLDDAGSAEPQAPVANPKS
jgi:hypothetical protein